MSSNHENYQRRLDFVHNLIQSFNFGQNARVEPIQYDPACPFKYNNFVYHISLPSALTSDHSGENGTLQPGCVAIPKGTRDLVMRLTNSDAEGMSTTARVENEVAIMTLASSALRSYIPNIVPRIYGWASAAGGSAQGWILQEFMPGSPGDASFKALNPDEKKNFLLQMAKILKGLQDFELPSSIKGFGGVTFDESGEVISGAMSSGGLGPWPTYEEFFRHQLDVALKTSDTNPYIKGWHAKGLRKRLDAFVSHGVAAEFDGLASAADRVIVHGDFTTNNILFDAKSGRITALLDYDFACISHPSFEFLKSFHSTDGALPGWTGDQNSEQMALRKAKLEGFPDPLPPTTENGVKWEVAKAWEDALEAEDVSVVDTLLSSILPWGITNSTILTLWPEDRFIQIRDENEELLSQLMAHLGF
ncbi:kinase-like domain-containing protein [Triangularia verruculosa]|uniref:Kinase-like domain-containing protein n=1 Tax=Triangularia verruculosa TaxID=2587418 RepID=A0AAN6XCZ3_9PEZI|nr:kinase-like domain-containing protein [Triangularia verruculosa]